MSPRLPSRLAPPRACGGSCTAPAPAPRSRGSEADGTVRAAPAGEPPSARPGRKSRGARPEVTSGSAGSLAHGAPPEVTLSSAGSLATWGPAGSHVGLSRKSGRLRAPPEVMSASAGSPDARGSGLPWALPTPKAAASLPGGSSGARPAPRFLGTCVCRSAAVGSTGDAPAGRAGTSVWPGPARRTGSVRYSAP